MASAIVATLGCAPSGESPKPFDERRTFDIRGQLDISDAQDDAVVRSVGVPSDPDDTIGTRYLKHEAPRRLAAPDCRPSGLAFCLVDTASKVRSIEVEEGGMPDERATDWLVFAASPDSIQLFAVAASSSYIKMAKKSAGGFYGEHAAGVDASWIRVRFPSAGAYVFHTRIESDTAVQYELRVAPVIATGASRPIGASASLTIVGDSSTLVAVWPTSMDQLVDSVAPQSYAVYPGTYQVLLVRDSNYVACRLPCTGRRSFTLRPSDAVTLSP